MATPHRLYLASSATPRTSKCAAAQVDDPTPCEGGRAVVRVVDQHGAEATGCVHHAAALYATSVRAHVYASPGHKHAVTDVYHRAQVPQPIPVQQRIAA